jgi:hypothetical protein
VKGLGLNVSAREIEKLNLYMRRAVADISNRAADKQKAEFDKVSEEMRSRFDNLSSVIHSELEQRIFYAVPSDRQDYCRPGWLIDSPVSANFPKALTEFQCAGRCLAYGESTAAVFHSMRALDSGLKLVYESLGEKYDARNWDGIARKIESEMTRKHQDKTRDWREKEPFYSEVLTDIRSIGRAHRNPALHEIERRYTDADAKYLLDVSLVFMSHLAEHGYMEEHGK